MSGCTSRRCAGREPLASPDRHPAAAVLACWRVSACRDHYPLFSPLAASPCWNCQPDASSALPHHVQARVEQNLQRISELKEESARLGDAVQSVKSAQQAQRTAGNGVAELAAAAAAAPAAVAAAATQAPALAVGVEEVGAHPPPAALTKAVSASRSAVAPGHAQNRACGGAGPRAAQLSLEQEIEAQRRRGLYSR